MYDDVPKREIVQSIVEGLREKLTPAECQVTSQTPDDKPPFPPESEPPTTYLWTLYFLAQHYSHISQHSHALSLLETAILHTPTLPELLMCKARVLKRIGDPWGAAKAMDEARVLDLQDRFLNTKCAKYRLRAGLEEEAQEVFGLFTKVIPPVWNLLLPLAAVNQSIKLILVPDAPRKTRPVLDLTWKTCNHCCS